MNDAETHAGRRTMNMTSITKPTSRTLRRMAGMTALLCGMLISDPVWAGNIAMSGVKRFGQAPGSHWMVQFNVQWENSWRNDITNQAPPYNYDAAWMFMKWRTNDPSTGVTSAWYHASLSTNTSDHVAPGGSIINVGLSGRAGAWGTNAVGVFIYRSANGSGTFTANKVRLRWNHAADGVADNAPVELKVCAIEMVYVPANAFYVGSTTGALPQEWNRFHAGGLDTNTPFQITNENQLAIGDVVGQLYSISNNAEAGDRTGILSNDFPKGYAAFYGMKTEISQGQYVDFLNTITRTQQYNSSAESYHRFVSTTVNDFMANVSGITYPTNRNGVQLISDPGNPSARVYANNLNTNNAPNSTNDGQWIACNWLNWADVAAYCDWAGLRPMTELEFVKACRGTNAPVANGYAWGNASYTLATSIANSGQSNEAPGNASANAVMYNAGVQGPLRVGCLGIGVGTRNATGAGYYGMMELSGNVFARGVTTANPTGRRFTGMHGDGTLDTSGNANVTAWPGTDAVGQMLFGGSWNATYPDHYINNRNYADRILPSRYPAYSGRGVRSAP